MAEAKQIEYHELLEDIIMQLEEKTAYCELLQKENKTLYRKLQTTSEGPSKENETALCAKNYLKGAKSRTKITELVPDCEVRRRSKSCEDDHYSRSEVDLPKAKSACKAKTKRTTRAAEVIPSVIVTDASKLSESKPTETKKQTRKKIWCATLNNEEQFEDDEENKTLYRKLQTTSEGPSKENETALCAKNYLKGAKSRTKITELVPDCEVRRRSKSCEDDHYSRSEVDLPKAKSACKAKTKRTTRAAEVIPSVIVTDASKLSESKPTETKKQTRKKLWCATLNNEEQFEDDEENKTLYRKLQTTSEGPSKENETALCAKNYLKGAKSRTKITELVPDCEVRRRSKSCEDDHYSRSEVDLPKAKSACKAKTKRTTRAAEVIPSVIVTDASKLSESKPTETKKQTRKKLWCATLNNEEQFEDDEAKEGGPEKVHTLSPVLSSLVGQKKMAYHAIVKKIWAYIKQHDLQDPKNTRFVICNDALFKVVGKKRYLGFCIGKYLKKHFID